MHGGSNSAGGTGHHPTSSGRRASAASLEVGDPAVGVDRFVEWEHDELGGADVDEAADQSPAARSHESGTNSRDVVEVGSTLREQPLEYGSGTSPNEYGMSTP